MELCPKCKTQLRIRQPRMVVEGDKSPDTPTTVYLVQEQFCANPHCVEYKQTVDEIKHLLYAEKDDSHDH